MTEESEKQGKQEKQPRPPVVVVLGHIDSGKTSILDFIKKTKVTEKESGGITQHIGAYEVEHSVSSKQETGQMKRITFIDTPGHEAFSAMRSRGVEVADIAILVIDAGEGVKTQTKEAISYIEKSKVSMIVAINKMDRPEADPQRIKRELEKENVLVESMGGKIPSIEISARTGQNINELLEVILLIAEMENFQAELLKSGQGVIIESYLDPKRGPTATLLLRDGKLKTGDFIGTSFLSGKIKILENFQGEAIKEAFPSMPVVVVGFEDVPQIGEEFKTFETEVALREFVKKKKKVFEFERMPLVQLGQKLLNLILKTDVLGSGEVIEGVLKNLPQEKIILNLLKKDVGEINESDIKTAQGNKAIILGFRVKANQEMLKLAERLKVKILFFDIIYELVEGVRKIMDKLVGFEKEKIILGKIKILKVFRQEKNRQIVGGRVFEGEIKKGRFS